MSVIIPKNSATAALRRIYFTLVDATDLVTPKDITVTGVKPTLSFNGGTPAAATNDIVKVSGANGEYYIELTQAESNTSLGTVRGYLTPSGCALTKFEATVGPVESYDSPATSIAIAAGGITAASFAADALTASAAAADLIAEIQNGLATATVLAGVAAKTTNLPGAPAAVGSAMTLATDAVNASTLSTDAVAEIVAGVFAKTFGADFQNKDFTALVKVIVSALVGVSTGAGTATEVLKSPSNGTTVVTVTNDGTNRTASALA
jgi:hypothetical protein